MINRYINDESGQGMVEYGLIIALIAVSVIAALTALGSNIINIFNKVGEELSKAASAA